MRINIIAIIIILIIPILLYSTYNTSQESNKEIIVLQESNIEVLVPNLDTPWAIDFLPSEEMIFTERFGKVSIYKDGKTTLIATIEVSEKSESGLAGIAVDPNFNENNFIYLYYTTKDKENRVSRFILKNEKLNNEVILLDDIPSARFHDGGRIKFGPDGKLYITTGDATTPTSAQDISSLAGKILRMNKDGSIPKDNLFENFVYSLGHRNPQGIAWNPITKTLYSSEHGPTKNDEVNIIIKGENYGWPFVECDTTSKEYSNPIRCFSEFTLAPSSLEFYDNNLYIVGLRGKQLRKLVLDKDSIVSEEILISDIGRIREVVAHNDYLYIATSNRDGRGIPKVNDDRIIKIKI